MVENRWQLILRGLGTTLFIGLCAGALGLLIGFVTVLLSRTGKAVPRAIVTGYHAVIGGVPIVVVLMVFYYIVFNSRGISGVAVAILAFALAFGANAGATMSTAIRGIDAVQEESGLALGYTRRQTFRKIVFPQALEQCLSQLMGQFVSLVKDTSVVGFIAVLDLTRAGDLIRARTMEAFFPLLAIALIYFIVCRVLHMIIKIVMNRIENRPRTIKEIKL